MGEPVDLRTAWVELAAKEVAAGVSAEVSGAVWAPEVGVPRILEWTTVLESAANLVAEGVAAAAAVKASVKREMAPGNPPPAPAAPSSADNFASPVLAEYQKQIVVMAQIVGIVVEVGVSGNKPGIAAVEVVVGNSPEVAAKLGSSEAPDDFVKAG